MLTSSPSFSRERELWFLLPPCNSLPNRKGDSPQFSALVQLVPTIEALNPVSLFAHSPNLRAALWLTGEFGHNDFYPVVMAAAQAQNQTTCNQRHFFTLFGLPGTGAELMEPRNPRGPSQDPNPRQTQTLVLGRGF